MEDDVLSQVISAREAARLLGLSQAQVTHLLRHDTMQGKKVGREWVTTLREVDRYKASNPKPGPKPRMP